MEQSNDPNRHVLVATPQLAGVPYEKKWEILKPSLRELFVTEEKTVPEIMALMKDRHAFSAKYGVASYSTLQSYLSVEQQSAVRTEMSRLIDSI